MRAVKMDSHRPLDEFDMGTPETAARVGNELEQIADRYPDDDARNEANGDMDAFLEAAGFSDGRKADRVTSERIQWMYAALEAWVDFVTDPGMVSNAEIQPVLDRINLDTR